MKPTIVLVGRPNVGKSTLFNRLTRSRAALVADFPGLTRDRHYGHGRVGGKSYLVVDTGGLASGQGEGILEEMARQTRLAIDEADAIVFLVDARAGMTAQDERIADTLRKTGRPVYLAVNKAEGMPPALATAEFYALGLGEPHAISASHGDGVESLMEEVLAPFPGHEDEEPAEHSGIAPKIAIVGRPNVGKSTLLNALLGEERVIAFDEPGTTRDSIYVDLRRDGQRYVLIDTAGVRRKGRVFEAIEKFSVVKTLKAIDDAHVVVLVLDAHQDISEQDAHLAGFVLEAGKAVVVAVNKWDGLDDYRRKLVERTIAHKLAFLSFARFHYISALAGRGLAGLFQSIDEAHRAAFAKLSTPRLTRVLAEACAAHPPPMAGRFRPKLRYAHQGGQNPPVIVIHGTNVANIPDSYRRYLENRFRESFALVGTPLRVEFKQGKNPFAERKQLLTPRQEAKKRRHRRWLRKTFGR